MAAAQGGASRLPNLHGYRIRGSETHRPTQRPWVPENKRLCGVCVFSKHSTPNGVSAESKSIAALGNPSPLYTENPSEMLLFLT